MVATRCAQGHDLIIGVTPFELPNAQLAAALSRAGALGVLDLGRDSARARTALAQMSRWAREPWGVRVPAGCHSDRPGVRRSSAVDVCSLRSTT